MGVLLLFSLFRISERLSDFTVRMLRHVTGERTSPLADSRLGYQSLATAAFSTRRRTERERPVPPTLVCYADFGQKDAGTVVGVSVTDSAKHFSLIANS